MEKIIKARSGFRAVRNAIMFKLMILHFMWVAFLIRVITPSPAKRRHRYVKNAHFHSKLGVKIMNIHVHKKNQPRHLDSTFLYVSNHFGFVDTFIAASLFPMMFVSSVEIQKTPVLGWVLEMAGCLFVERRSRSNIQNELKNMIDALKDGHRVAIYPEAKAWNAEEILPFKRTLISAAAHAGVPIQPVVLNVKSVNGESFTLKWRDHVCWWGDASFFSVIMKTFSTKKIVVELEYLEPLYPKPDDDRAYIADMARERIVSKFIPVIKN